MSLALGLTRSEPVSFHIVDIAGRIVWSAPIETRVAGRWTLRWPGTTHDGAPARPGVYLARVRAGGAVFTRLIAVIR